MKAWACALAPALLCASCLSSGAVRPDRRVVPMPEDDATWHAVASDELPGLYHSERVEGAMAAVVRSIHYCFQADGAYTGAALLGDARPRFEVLDGRWTLDGTTLRLDDAPPGELVGDGERIRISGIEGVLVLRRDDRQ